jgi:hypothetical protein
MDYGTIVSSFDVVFGWININIILCYQPIVVDGPKTEKTIAIFFRELFIKGYNQLRV